MNSLTCLRKTNFVASTLIPSHWWKQRRKGQGNQMADTKLSMHSDTEKSKEMTTHSNPIFHKLDGGGNSSEMDVQVVSKMDPNHRTFENNCNGG